MPEVTLLRHDANRGVTAAILTGMRAAKTEIVCSIDSDCTYDPHELAVMIPLLAPGVDLVTASPYHPRGSVRNVPGWRLTLSRGASLLYRQVLQQKLYTYTSCFRVFRRSAILDLVIKRTGFLGVAEIIGQLDLRGSRIVEHPTTLAVRVFGFSKMRTLWTIAEHLGLLQDLLRQRLTERFRKRNCRQPRRVPTITCQCLSIRQTREGPSREVSIPTGPLPGFPCRPIRTRRVERSARMSSSSWARSSARRSHLNEGIDDQVL